MPDLTTLTGPLLDDGYPTDEALALIPAWTGTPRALVEDVLADIFTAYGTVTVTPAICDLGRTVHRVYLATGGWSGNESAITALQRGMFWIAWWQSSHRGGAFTFDVPTNSWDTPMIEWPQPPSDYATGWAAASALARTAHTDARATLDPDHPAHQILTALDTRLTAGPGEDQ